MRFSFFAIILILSALQHSFSSDKSEKFSRELASQPKYECVGRVFINSGFYNSCVLIDSKHAISATGGLTKSTKLDRAKMPKNGEDFYIMSYPIKGSEIDPDRIRLVFGADTLRVKRFSIHPLHFDSSLMNAEGQAEICDIALFELETPVKNIQPAKINTKTDEFGKDVMTIGFEKSESSIGLGEVWEKKAYWLKADSLVGYKHNGERSMLLSIIESWKDRKRKDPNAPRPKIPEYVNYGRFSEGAIFIERESGWELAGIASFSLYTFSTGSSGGYLQNINDDGLGTERFPGSINPSHESQEDLRDRKYFTRVSAFAEWIKKEIEGEGSSKKVKNKR